MKILGLTFKSSTRRHEDARIAALADPIIDRLLEKTDRRLESTARFRERLREPVLAARARVAEMIARIPGPFEVSPRSWAQDPGIRPLFARGEDATEAYVRDEAVRAFFERHPASDCCGMLALVQAERRVLGTVQQGDILAEVARTTVSYGEPRVLAPALDEVAVREELAMRALEYLVLRGMERVGAMKVARRELEREGVLLRAQLQLARRRGAGFGAVAAPDDGDPPDYGTLERDLARTVGQLEQVATKNLLPVLQEEILAALAHPEEHLSIEPCAVSLDAMNFVVPPSPQAVTPRVALLWLPQRGTFAVLIGRFPPAQPSAAADRLEEAARSLQGIRRKSRRG